MIDIDGFLKVIEGFLGSNVDKEADKVKAYTVLYKEQKISAAEYINLMDDMSLIKDIEKYHRNTLIYILAADTLNFVRQFKEFVNF